MHMFVSTFNRTLGTLLLYVAFLPISEHCLEVFSRALFSIDRARIRTWSSLQETPIHIRKSASVRSASMN
jgi:hypothetical protein